MLTYISLWLVYFNSDYFWLHWFFCRSKFRVSVVIWRRVTILATEAFFYRFSPDKRPKSHSSYRVIIWSCWKQIKFVARFQEVKNVVAKGEFSPESFPIGSLFEMLSEWDFLITRRIRRGRRIIQSCLSGIAAFRCKCLNWWIYFL